MPGVFAGMIIGVGGAAFLVLTKRDPFGGFSAGFLALCANFAVVALVSILTPVPVVVLAKEFSANASVNP
jgi:SSS family solute:Na+ symporter